jgi:predicted dehydrogenase
MLDAASPDIVSICTPDDTHSDMLELCLNYSSVKAVWCEKPLAIEFKRAKGIVSEYKRRGVILAVNYSRRWDPQMQRIKKAIGKDELGKIQKAIVYYSKGICHNGSHAIDLLLDWFGLPTKMQVFRSKFDFVDNDPTVDAFLLMGEVPVYFIGVDGREYSIFEMHVLGTSGRVDVKNFGREIEWFIRHADYNFKCHRQLASKGVLYKTDCSFTMAYALKDIVDAISSGGRVLSDGESALITLKVVHELSARAGRA